MNCNASVVLQKDYGVLSNFLQPIIINVYSFKKSNLNPNGINTITAVLRRMYSVLRAAKLTRQHACSATYADPTGKQKNSLVIIQ